MSSYRGREDREGQFIVRGGSMRPFFNPGDIVIVEQSPPEKLKIGNVVLFASSHGKDIIHRIIRISRNKGTLYFHTRGDNKRYPDEEFSSEVLKGKVSGVYRKGVVRNIARIDELAALAFSHAQVRLKIILYMIARLVMPLICSHLPIEWKTMKSGTGGEVKVALLFGRVIAKLRDDEKRNSLWIHPVFRGHIDIHDT